MANNNPYSEYNDLATSKHACACARTRCDDLATTTPFVMEQSHARVVRNSGIGNLCAYNLEVELVRTRSNPLHENAISVARSNSYRYAMEQNHAEDMRRVGLRLVAHMSKKWHSGEFMVPKSERRGRPMLTEEGQAVDEEHAVKKLVGGDQALSG